MTKSAGPIIALLLLAGLYPAAAAEEPQRPKIGLALGGGGAKGGAHVGVLEVLEELHVPIDYVAGTSIGAIVGGLYATGMSAAEIRETIAAVDWQEVLQDKPTRRDLSFRRKEEDSRYLFAFEFGVGLDGLRFPPGLISGQNLFFMLQALTLPAANISNFDRLAIPFRAVATDVSSGDMVVLGNGQLASAIRASMALPAIFSPVELDGRLLIDGGLVRNLPVDVVREMGADVVIAVDLGAPLSEHEVQRTMADVLSQTMRMLTRFNVEPQLSAADVVIVPPVASYGTMSFRNIQQIMDLGTEEARKHEAELRRLAVDAEAYDRHRARQKIEAQETVEVAFVELEGNRRVEDRIVENQVRLEPGSNMSLGVLPEDVALLLSPRSRRETRLRRRGEVGPDLRQLSIDMRRLYGLGDFESIDFRFAERGGEEGVVIHMREKPWGPNFLHFGAEISSDDDGNLDLQLLLNLTNTRMNRRGGEWRNDLLLGKNRSVFSEFYQPLDFRGRFFVAPRLSLENRRPTFFEAGRAVTDLDVEVATFGLDLGYQLGSWGELRLGLERTSGDVAVETGSLPSGVSEEIDLGDIDVGGIRLQAILDRLDSITFPRYGSRSLLRLFFALDSLGSDAEYTRIEARMSRFFSRGRHTGFFTLGSGWSPGGELPVYDELTLGGFGSLSGLAEDELRGQYLGILRLGYYQRRFGNLHLGGFFEAGNVWQTSEEAEFSDLIYAATLLAGLETPVGPLYVAYGRVDGGRSKIYFNLGRTLP